MLTGEDWPGVHLQLSTAMPTVGGRPPSLRTLTVRKQPAIVQSEHRSGRRSEPMYQTFSASSAGGQQKSSSSGKRQARESMPSISRSANFARESESYAAAEDGCALPPAYRDPRTLPLKSHS